MTPCCGRWNRASPAVPPPPPSLPRPAAPAPRWPLFLWRTESSPAVSGGASFADVADNTYYTNAVIWAANSGVTSGTSATTFSPTRCAPVLRS
ncbi:MAG: S-layer homology domain-containing protein [Intestinimonas sp.]